MNIKPTENVSISFGYSSKLKTLFKEGRMPTVKRGLYGNLINKSNATLEHLKPYSKGGKSVLSNFALAASSANSARGNRPLAEFLDKEMLEKYLSQFNFKISDKFNGFEYQKMIRETCEREGIGDTIKKGVLRVSEGTSKKIITSAGDSFIKRTGAQEIQKLPESLGSSGDLGNLKFVIEHLDEINLLSLPKKILKALKSRGLIN